MKLIALPILVALSLSGCAQLTAFDNKFTSAVGSIETKGQAALLRINTSLVKNRPNVAKWADSCAVAFGYVAEIAQVFNFSPANIARAQAAHDSCLAIAANPPASAADIARGIASALTDLQLSAQKTPANAAK